MTWIEMILGATVVLFVPGWAITALLYPMWKCRSCEQWWLGLGLNGWVERGVTAILLSIITSTAIVFIHLTFFSLDRENLVLSYFTVTSVLLLLVALRYAWHCFRHAARG